MNERRPKHTLRRSKRLSQVLASKSPSKKGITPKKLNKREHLKTKRQSNSQQKNSDEADNLISNCLTKQLMVIIPNLTPKQKSYNSERRSSLRSQEKFRSELERSKKDGNVSKKAMNDVKSNKERGSKKESAERDNILTMTEGKTNCKPRRSARLSQISLVKTPLKKSATPKSLNRRKQLKAKRKPNGRRKKSVKFDTLLGYGICPPGLKPQQSRKRKISSDLNESVSRRRTSLRLCKRIRLENEAPQKNIVSKKTPNATISNKKRGSKKKQKPGTNDIVNNSILSSINSPVVLNNSSISKSSNNKDSIPLDDLLFVTSSRKKKSRDITESSGICSAHSSFASSCGSNPRSKPDDLGFASSASMNSTNCSFKIPESKKKPGKNTLKYKRLILNELNLSNVDHEDDLLENMKMTPFKKVFDLDNESEVSWNIATPKCGFKLSPFLPKRTPVFKDCFSPTELRISRKNAEEYIHRNKKKKQLLVSPELPKSKRTSDNSDVLAVLTRLSQEQKNIERSLDDEFLSDEEKEDGYNSEEEELILNNSVAI